jgi:glycosyltransferase involved in cell wall biosynthesis
MKSDIIKNQINKSSKQQESSFALPEIQYPEITSENRNRNIRSDSDNRLPEVLFISSYPPRECGIATYSQDLIKALNIKFGSSFAIRVCALESGYTNNHYPEEVKFRIDTTQAQEYPKLANYINQNNLIKLVVIQHEFGFFEMQTVAFKQFLIELIKPVILVFHTVIPKPDLLLKSDVRSIVAACRSVIVMTNNSAKLLIDDYEVSREKISVIAHGTHLVSHLNKEFLKEKYGLKGKKILSTFGLLSSGKSIETTLEALPAIVKADPEVVFLIIGKTHPNVVKYEGELYREKLEMMVSTLNLRDHVKFINSYLALPELLEYLQLTDIYLFTTNDPNQAVSGTFAYAMSCACPIISTPIPHAREVLSEDTGIIVDFKNPSQLANSVIKLLADEPLRSRISMNALQKIVATSWENSAIAHAMLFKENAGKKIKITYDLPDINLRHIKLLTTGFGMVQFSKINQPDIDSGYTLDDNARALIAMCMHYEQTSDKRDLDYIRRYFDFIKYCLRPQGDLLNYVDKDGGFTDQNTTNLEDANGRAVWALGYLISRKSVLPAKLAAEAKIIIQKILPHIKTINSPRAMAFAIKGIYYYHSETRTSENIVLIKTLAKKMVRMYMSESAEKWEWFESSLTYANSILPEAMLYSWLLTGETIYKEIAISSLNFLLSLTFNKNGIEVISNKKWLHKGMEPGQFGEQPIDVAYTIMTLSKFYDTFNDKEFLNKMVVAFNWFLGNNRLHQIIYNPCTGGCYDGLEELNVNLNQGAESAVSYLMARLTMEKYNNG